jgi:hypothetical protein
MHPTADTADFMYLNRSGRRVMPGVRLLGFLKSKTEACGWRRRGSPSTRRAISVAGAALRITRHGASREVRRSEGRGPRQVRHVSIAHPNKPMHPTADTTDVMLRQWLGAAGDCRRYAASHIVAGRMDVS